MFNRHIVTGTALSGLLLILGAGCASTADDSTGEPDVAGTETSVAEQATSLASDCWAGWHAHYVDWPAVAIHCGSFNCSNQCGTWGNGTYICMEDGPARSCNGEGYSKVATPGSRYYYWARTEAFTGH